MNRGATIRQFAASGSATIGFFIVGTYLGWASPSIPRMTKGDTEPHLTDDEASWVISLFTIGQIFSPPLGGFLLTRIGRKFTLIGTAAPILLAWILIITGKSVGILYAARFIAGLGVGVIFQAGPVYLGEIAEDRIRGALATMFQVLMSFGVLFECCVGPYTSTTLLGILSAIFPALFVAIFIWMPESPYFYLSKNRREDAQKSLMWLRYAHNQGSVQEELNKMEKYVEEDKNNRGGIKELISDRGSRKALIIGTCLALFQACSGIIVLLSYSTEIFQDSNTSLDPDISVIITGGIQLAVSAFSSSIVDIAGRRPLMIFSSLGCTFALAAEGVFFYLKSLPDGDVSSLDWLPVTAIIVFLIVYMMGLGPIPIALQGELFPARVKGIGTTITSIMLGAGASIVTKLFQIIKDNWGTHVAFWLFAANCLACAIFCFCMLPETKGKSFLEIYQELSNLKKDSPNTDIEKVSTSQES